MARSRKHESAVTPERVTAFLRGRFSPITGLTPPVLTRQLDDYDCGRLRELAATMETIEDRDDILKCVAPKRKKSVARNDYDILLVADTPAAKRHQEALQNFYNNLTCTSAVNRNQRGGLRLLIRQMMDAVGKGYAVHEILWKPRANALTAEFRFVPLWFFENTTGRLRFLQQEGAIHGVDLEDGGWMVTVGDGLMKACAVAYMYKHLPLRDWLIYSERHGMPGIQGKTDAKKNSTEWNDMVESVESFAADFACVTSRDDSIEKIDMSTSGQLPYPKLVERMDKALSAIWRGADLSTLSADTKGASLQGDESDVLEADDAVMISETLNSYADKWAIYYATGDTEPLAYIQVKTSTKQDIEKDLKIDEFLTKSGAPVAVAATLERYGRPMPDEKEELLKADQTARSESTPYLDNESLSGTGIGTALPAVSTLERVSPAPSAGLRKSAMEQLAAAQAEVLQPVRNRLAEIVKIEDPEFQRSALRNFLNELPGLLKQMNANPATSEVIEGLISAGLLNGAAEAAQERIFRGMGVMG